MKQTLSSLFIMIFAFSFSQNQLKVINSKNQKPIYNASVYCDDDLQEMLLPDGFKDYIIGKMSEIIQAHKRYNPNMKNVL